MSTVQDSSVVACFYVLYKAFFLYILAFRKDDFCYHSAVASAARVSPLSEKRVEVL